MKQTKRYNNVIELNGREVSYELHRGPYKNINLRVRGDGSVRVSANRSVSVARIESFLLANEAFLVRALERASQAEVADVSPWRDGGAVPILGRERLIRVILGGRARAVLEEDRVVVTVREETEEEIRRGILRLLEQEAERVIEEMREDIACRFTAYRIPEHQYRFRYMVSQWGSCCPSKRTITFNKYLACVPPECIEYVMVHETAHFLELNHSPAFWQIIGEILPDWK